MYDRKEPSTVLPWYLSLILKFEITAATMLLLFARSVDTKYLSGVLPLNLADEIVS